MDKFAIDRASFLLQIPHHGPGLASSFRRSQPIITLQALCSEAMASPERRILDAQEITRIAARAYRLVGMKPWDCTARELADALDLPDGAGGDDPMAIFWEIARALLAPTNARDSVCDRCWLMLELAAPATLMAAMRLAQQSGFSMPVVPPLPDWVWTMSLGRRNKSGILPAMPKAIKVANQLR